MVLGNDFNGEVVLPDVDVRARPDGLHQSALYLGTGVVGVVQYAELRVAALAVQVEVAALLAVEVDAPADQLLNLCRGVSDHLLHGGTVGDVVAGNDGVGNVLVKGVYLQVGHRRHAALCERGVGLVQSGLANHTHAALLGTGHLQRVAHTGHACSYDEEIVLVNHCF